MQWPTTILVFPLFPALLLLIKKKKRGQNLTPHGLATSVIYTVRKEFELSVIDY
jgi:hypothetical protein